MKYKNYGNNDKEFDSGLGLELIEKYDDVSDRSLNRAFVNINENQEEIYELLNNVMKTVYGSKGNAIIPGIYEDFDAEGFIINSFCSNTDNFYLRVPTGAMILKSNSDEVEDPFYKFGEKKYKDYFSEGNLTKDPLKSYSFVNRPNVNLLERQLANLIGLELDDLENDIKIEATELPIVHPVYVLDESELPVTDSSGNFEFVKDENKKIIYNCDFKNAKYASDKIKNQSRIVTLNKDPQGKDSKTEVLDRFYIKYEAGGKLPVNFLQPIKEGDEEDPDTLYFTDDIEKAKKAVDYNGTEKKRLGYNLKVCIATQQGVKEEYWPNKKEHSYWEIRLPDQSNSKGKYTVELLDESNSQLLKFGFDINVPTTTADELNNILYRNFINQGNKYLYVKRINIKYGSNQYNGIKIINKTSQTDSDNYKLTIKKDEEDLTNISGSTINKMQPEKSTKQEYYYNMFELVNDFVQKYKNYFTTTDKLYNYLAGETILKIENTPGPKSYNIYYDTSFDVANNRDKDNYDKSGRLLISTNEETNKNLIKLFTVEIQGKENNVSKSKPKILSIQKHIDLLDRKTLYSKMADLKTLNVGNRTDLHGQFTFTSSDSGSSGDPSRGIEVFSKNVENYIKENQEQSRIYSPILRLTTTEGRITDELKKSEEKNVNVVTAADENDNPKNFSDSFIVKNLYDDKEETIYHHTNKDTGIIINKNKGIDLYTNDDNDIQLVSDKGNINLINSGTAGAAGTAGTIGIKNLKDEDSISVDILGRTQIRSSQGKQLVINSKGEKDTTIEFQNKDKLLGTINFKSVASKGETDPVKHADISLDNEKLIDITSKTTTINPNVVIENTTSKTNGTSLTIKNSGSEKSALDIKGKSKFIGDVNIGEFSPEPTELKEQNLTVVGKITGNGGTMLTGSSDPDKEGASNFEIKEGTITAKSDTITIKSSGEKPSSIELKNDSSKETIYITTGTTTINSILNIDNGEGNTTIKGAKTTINSTSGVDIAKKVTINNGELDLGADTTLAHIHTDASGNIIFSW